MVIDAAGALYFSNLKDLTAGTTSIANYDADRIIFYPSSDKNKYAAVVSLPFVPLVSPTDDFHAF
jgi:hypothetical protein